MYNDFYEQLSEDNRVKNLFPVDNECGFYELCRDFVAFAKSGIDNMVNVDGKLAPCYTAGSISVVSGQVKQFAEKHSIKDLKTLLAIANDFFDKSATEQELKQLAFSYRESGNDLPKGYSHTTAFMIDFPDNVINRIINTVSGL